MGIPIKIFTLTHCFKKFYCLIIIPCFKTRSMKRRASERGISTEDLASKQRIVRRKRRTPSPDLERVTSKSQREVRTSGGGGITTSSGTGGGVASGSGGLYTSKYASKYEQRSHKTDSQIREERLGTKYDSYNPGSGGTFRSQTQQDPRTERHHHHRTNASGGGGGTGAGGGHHHPSPHHNIQHTYVGGQGEKFEYSLRVGNLDFKIQDHELKKALFNKFKKYGYVNIKLLGNGKERHAFINFARENDARIALGDTQDCNFHGHLMDVNWSRSTLHRFPDLLSGGHSESRSTVLNAKRRLLGPVSSRNSRSRSRSRSSSPMTRRGVAYKEEYHHQHHQSPRDGRGEHGLTTQSASSGSRTTRDISYRTTRAVSVSPPPLPHTHERGVAGHVTSDDSRHSPSKTIPSAGGTIVDSNATRTLFVGHLEYDITERELRDLFGPYGRIESVDIKSTRQTNSAYAFVKFFTITDAINAKNDIHGRQYGNFRLKIGFGKGNPSIKVWIGGISCFADLTEIRQELDRFGLIRKVEYVKGDNHAMVHFDSMDAAQTAVNSLQEYRFRSTNRPLKIDILSKSLAPRGSEFDDFDIEVISPTSSHMESRWPGGNKSTNSRGSTTDLSTGGGGGGGSGENYRRRITREDSRGREEGGGRGETHYRHHQPPSPEMSARNGRSSLYAGSDSSERNRIVSESANSGSRSNEERSRSGAFNSSRESRYSGGGTGTKFERGGEHASYRKRPRSPSMNEEEHFNSSTADHHYHNRRHSADDGSSGGMGGADMGGASFNGASEYRSKKPRNNFDAYKYHKLYGNRSMIDDGGRGGGGSRYGSAHYDREKEHHHHHHADSFSAGDPREHHAHRGGGDHRDYHRDDRGRGERGGGGGGERERDRERERRDRHLPSSIKDDPRRDSNDRRDSNASKDDKKDSLDDAKKSEKESSAPPAVPPPPVLISNDTADTALKLNNSTDAPTGNGVTNNSNLNASSAETISDLAKLFPIAWKGTLVLKNTGFPTRMHLIGGDPTVVELLVRSKEGKDEVSSLRITQRLRLEPPRLEEVNKRMASAGPSGHCILLALAGPTPSQSSGDDSRSDNGSVDLNTQLRPLKSLVSYLKQKEAAGIVALSGPEKGSVTSVSDSGERDNIIGVLHAFPPCEFSQKQLVKIAPQLGQDTAKEDHIVVLLVKGTV